MSACNSRRRQQICVFASHHQGASSIQLPIFLSTSINRSKNTSLVMRVKIRGIFSFARRVLMEGVWTQLTHSGLGSQLVQLSIYAEFLY